jgi:hypothetical protein
MTKSAHTPGPWVVHEDDMGLSIHARDLLVADLVQHDEVDANAALISAAPDLLAALERLLEHGERLNIYSQAGEDAQVIAQAKAAVAKARGKA